MANRDKGRRKWGGFSQDLMNSKLEKDRLAGMRGGGNRASQALYRPGSGPLRKSGRSGNAADEYDNENGSQEKSRSTSVQYRLRQSQLNRSNQAQDSPPLSQIDNVTEKLGNTHIDYRNSNSELAQNTGHNISVGAGGNDSKRKNRKPEQLLYVPKKVKEALAEQDGTNRSPSHTAWEREREESDDRDSHSNRSHRSDRNRASSHSVRDNGSEGRGRDDNSKRYSGNRRHRHVNENEERWRTDSPVSARNCANRKDNLREVRQGSEPLSMTNQNDFNRTRDTRSVEPIGHSDKFQGKPPSGRRNNAKDSLSKNMKLELLPPRLQKKYLIDNGYALPSNNPGTSAENSWNGSSVTFQQASSGYNYPSAIQHSQTMQNLPPSGPLPPQSNWANTVPVRSRGRGRLRPEELEDKQSNQQNTNLNSMKSESFNPSSITASETAFDWSEEVELNEKLEQEYLSRSSSVLSIRESTAAASQQGTGQQQQQQRTLFDPNNPHKPIVITSPGSRAAVQRDNDMQISSVPVFQSNVGVTPSHYSFQSTQLDGMPSPYMNDQIGNMRPSWYDPFSASFHSAKNHCLLLDIERADLELQWIISSGGFTSRLDRVSYIRHFLQQSLKILLETDIKFCQAENVEQHFWKILFYNLIEMLRKAMPKENSEGRERYKQIMLNIIDEGTTYLESLLTALETTYEFKLDTFLASSSLPKGLGLLGLALVSAQKIFLFLGDLARYKEQANETSNYGKSRQWYLKAQQINPKNGRPYNQLALLAHYARRKLDAVYYYMRSLMASNPFHSARESLIALFDENRKKYLHYVSKF
ncbi:telomerase-binding protein est1a [Lasius niger]|uniref:Telomerase-binding protein est1a n=1 Tax=Lasius niger TaxID=67767 RepID=A0A0J7KQJ6_LASNI|nr:telomerase-binding protein est1a [Lasius niger]